MAAGKSTTMKIATASYADFGEAWVGGFNVVEKPMEVKQITGYLPEHNPLTLIFTSTSICSSRQALWIAGSPTETACR